MARKKDPNSVRQQAFKMLDKITKLDWNEQRDLLMTKFNIGLPYADSLINAHRRLARKSGAMVKVYSVRDIKDGKAVKPYLKVDTTFNPEADACLTPELAKARYTLELKNKIAKASQL